MQDDKLIYRDIDSPMGEMVAGATDAGACFLEWHDRGGVERILARVEKRYKLKPERGDSGHLDQLERELAEYFAGERSHFDVPIAVTGTTFEQTVWDQLLLIPHGETRSYGDLAKLLGKPGASRAVGRANGANYLSILIPCHRVIETGGGLRGYGGKLWRKQRLLELEGALTGELALAKG